MDIAKVSWLEHYTKKMYMDDAGCDYIGEMKKKRINAFKGKCYEATVGIYELCDGEGLISIEQRMMKAYGTGSWL